MEPAVHSNFEARLNAVKTAARTRVLGRYGLKDLFREHQIAPSAPGALNKAKTFGKHVAEFGREAVFGSPLTVRKQLADRYKRTGSILRTLGGHAKGFYYDPKVHPLIRGLSMGLPALELGNVLYHGDPATRKGDVAHALSGIAAAPFTARLGLLGIPLQGAAQAAARYAGSKLDPKPLPPPAPADVELNVPRHLARAWKSNSPILGGDDTPVSP